MNSSLNLTNDQLLQKALELAAMGRSVLPVGLDKKPLLAEWKSLQQQRATSDQIATWFDKLKPPAWAVVSGALSGIVIVDFDGEQGGAWLREFGFRPHVQTGSGGAHVHFKHPGAPVKTMNAKTAKDSWPWHGIDIRGEGGYALTIGRNSNGAYEQLRDFDDLDQFELLPAELRSLILKAAYQAAMGIRAPVCTKTQVDDLLIRKALDMVRRGQGRNNSGFWLACQLRDNEYFQAEAYSAMRRYAGACPTTNGKGHVEAYGDLEIRATLDSVFSASARALWGQPNIGEVLHANESPSDTDQNPLPMIQVSDRQLREPTNEALDALNKFNTPPLLFVRSESMVVVFRNEFGRLVVKRVDDQILRRLLSEAANFQGRSSKGFPRNVPPPMNVVQNILALSPAAWGLAPLDGIVEAPVLRSDGSILDQEGYDSATRLYYSPDPSLRIPRIPMQPTREQIDAAKVVVHEPLKEFPFEDQASRANAIAALVTPVVKAAIKKPTPLCVISARAAGTGKSLIAELIAITHTGRPAEMLSAPQDHDEWRKQITTALINGGSVIVFDNVSNSLESPELCKTLTADVHGDRLLRTNDAIRIGVNCVWFATGNNIQLRGDMPRRCYWIRMDARMSNPFLRDSFSHPDLKKYAMTHRGEMLTAILTLARAWFVAGRPKPSVTRLGSFEEWTITVGGILAHAGIEGFLGNAIEAYEQADQEGVEWELFFRVLHEVFGEQPFRASQVWDAMRETYRNGYKDVPTPAAKQIKDTLPETIAEAQERQASFVRSLGKRLAELEGKRFGSDEIHVARGKVVHKVQEWQIQVGVTELNGLCARIRRNRQLAET